MGKELEQFLLPGSEIPWESAASFFVSVKESTIEKVAVDESAREAVEKAKAKGLLSGIRSSVAQDVTHATRVRRTRGARASKELGTVGGAAAGYALGRKGGLAGKLGGTAVGALIGRGAGKSVGEEIDRARTLKRYDRSKAKKAEIEKTSSVSRVRHLWKIAQGETPTEALEGSEGATPAPGPVDVTGMTQQQALAAGGGVPAGPRVVQPSGAPTPEDLARAEAEAQLEQEMVADELANQNAADYYQQIAGESQAQLAEAAQAAQEAQMVADQATQQAQMSQQQADAATQQLQMQSQQDAAEKQMLNDEALSARQNIMQMRQAMQAYRENLQDLALQDPTAMAGPSPEEQGMMPVEEQAMGGEAGKQVQEAEQAAVEANRQAAQAQKATAKDTAKQQSKAEMGKQSSAALDFLKEAAEGKSGWKRKALIGTGVGATVLGGGALLRHALKRGKGGIAKTLSGSIGKGKETLDLAESNLAKLKNINKTVDRIQKENKEFSDWLRKQSSVDLQEKIATDWSTRAIGAAVGAASGAGIQALSDRKGQGGMSTKERMLRSKLQSLQKKKNPTVFDKHMTTMTRALTDTAKINRQHPGSAAAMAAITGAVAGASVAPTAIRAGRSLF
jgi:hypothetical protein